MRYLSATSNMPGPKPFKGLAISALRPSDATVSARLIDFCGPSGKPSKALRAALIHEIGRISLLLKGYDGKYNTSRQESGTVATSTKSLLSNTTAACVATIGKR